MNSEERLLRLLSAERAAQPPSASFEHGLRSLRAALGGGAAGPPIAHGPLKLGLSLAAKWSVGSGLLVVAALSAGSAVSSRLVTSSAPAARVAAQAPLPSVLEPKSSPVVVEPSPAAPELPASALAHAGSGAVAMASSFAEELKLIKASKQDLDAGRLDGAAALLNEHARLYPTGVFQSERQALSVLLECRRSAQSGAAAARRFVAQQPASPFVDRISRACGLGPSVPSARTTSGPAAPAGSAAAANFPELGK